MRTSKPFQFKEFQIIQEQNPQKVGTDSMLLGAWTQGKYERILDIGTGTGILALMLAQKNPTSSITAIEPNQKSLTEAELNFQNSKFASQILTINTSLQNFGSVDKFDLIICNPPYYNGTYLSEDVDRNQARHSNDLPLFELYETVAELLTETGKFNLIVPYEIETDHIECAFDNGLYIEHITHTTKANGDKKRSLISFCLEDNEPEITELLVKDEQNNYSKAYIDLTKDFYLKDLSE